MKNMYRLNVAGIILRADSRLLICERSKQPGAWQFPQGGIDPGETAEEAVKREIKEEVGFEEGDYVIEKSRAGYRYDYPPEVLEYVRLKRHQPFVGQQQEYFLCRLREQAPEPRLDQREFAAFRWIDPEEFQIDWLPEFKKAVYAQVLADFFGIRPRA